MLKVQSKYSVDPPMHDISLVFNVIMNVVTRHRYGQLNDPFQIWDPRMTSY